MITTRNIVWVVALGSAWGVAEVFGKDLLAAVGVTGASIWLTAWAVLLLSVGRGAWNRIGSSAVIGLVAAYLKYFGPSPDYCHLLGIASTGVFFDLFASSLLRRAKPGWWRHAVVGVLSTYGSATFFVVYAVHVAHLQRWVDGGAQMALDHVLRGGSAAALAAVLLAPLGFWIGGRAAGTLPGVPAEDPLAAEQR